MCVKPGQDEMWADENRILNPGRQSVTGWLMLVSAFVIVHSLKYETRIFFPLLPASSLHSIYLTLTETYVSKQYFSIHAGL